MPALAADRPAWHARAALAVSLGLHLAVACWASGLAPVVRDLPPAPVLRRSTVALPPGPLVPPRPPPPPPPAAPAEQVLDNPVVASQPRAAPAPKAAPRVPAARPGPRVASTATSASAAGQQAQPAAQPASPGPSSDDEEPVFGATLESTTGGGKPTAAGSDGAAGGSGGGKGGNAPKSGGGTGPVAAAEVSTLPVPQGRCEGKYTDAARQAGVEGTVVLDLVVDADGRTTEIAVVRGLGHGLDEAAVTALQRCRFKPGERDGQKVAVRIRSFKIRFVLDGAD